MLISNIVFSLSWKMKNVFSLSLKTPNDLKRTILPNLAVKQTIFKGRGIKHSAYGPEPAHWRVQFDVLMTEKCSFAVLTRT